MKTVQCRVVQPDCVTILATIRCDIGLPVVAGQVLQLMNQAQTDARSLAEVIATDPALTLRVLKLANSPFYGFARRINTIKDAVVLLGHKTLGTMVLALAMKGMHKRTGDVERKLWEESAGYAMAARLVAQTAGGMNGDEAFLAGLMSNVGELICNNDNPALYAQILSESHADGQRERSSQAALPYSFSQLGAAVLYHWNFSPLMVASTYYAEQEDLSGEADDEIYRMCNVVHFGRALCKTAELGHYRSQALPAATGCAAQVLGFDSADITALYEQFLRQFKEKAAAFLDTP